jgi:hypothetical protein
MPRNFRVVAALVPLLLGVHPLCAQPSPDHGPRLVVDTVSGQNTFHLGERIPLKLSFTGPDDKAFAIDLANYDRSGRMYEDSFSIEPKAGWGDPLAAYFAYGSFIGGGLRGGQNLSSKAVTLNVNLNEWVRFDEPGTYTLSVTSHRVGPSGKRWAEFPERTVDLPSSNRLTLIVIPSTPQWQDATLSRILRDLPITPRNDAAPREPSPAQKDTVADLRFLGTAKAMPVLAAQLRDDSAGEWDAYFGLIGLPPAARESALLSMRSLLEAPDFPIGTLFLTAMSWLPIPSEVDLVSPGQMDRQSFEAFERDRTAVQDAEWQNLAFALHHKRGAALTASEKTLMETEPAHPDPNALAILGEVAQASFAAMSPADKAEELKDHWDILGSRELLPQIRKIATDPPAAADNENPFFSPRERIAVALRRWHEFEPANAEAEAIRQIGKAYPQLSARDVSYLPNESFPQFESLWAETLADGQDINDYQPAASLLLRFGTGAVAARMMEILRNPKDHLGNRLDPALAYLLKFEPSLAESLLQQKPDLLVGSMDSIARQTSPSALLTAAALRQIASPDPTGTADALSYLRHFGDEKVRDPIYKAFLAWFERIQNLAGKDLSDLPQEVQAQVNLREDFVAALLGNQGWIPSAQLRADVLLHRLDPNWEDQYEMALPGDVQVSIFAGGFEGDYASYEIGPFDAPNLKLFEEKLDQFPAGTRFRLQHVSCPDQHSQDVLEAGLPELFLKHGMKLVTPNEATTAAQ